MIINFLSLERFEYVVGTLGPFPQTEQGYRTRVHGCHWFDSVWLCLSLQAKYFTESRLLQREVKVLLQGTVVLFVSL